MYPKPYECNLRGSIVGVVVTVLFTHFFFHLPAFLFSGFLVSVILFSFPFFLFFLSRPLFFLFFSPPYPFFFASRLVRVPALLYTSLSFISIHLSMNVYDHVNLQQFGMNPESSRPLSCVENRTRRGRGGRAVGATNMCV